MCNREGGPSPGFASPQVLSLSPNTLYSSFYSASWELGILSTLQMLCRLIPRITWEVGTVVTEEETELERGSGTCPAPRAR